MAAMYAPPSISKEQVKLIRLLTALKRGIVDHEKTRDDLDDRRRTFLNRTVQAIRQAVEERRGKS